MSNTLVTNRAILKDSIPLSMPLMVYIDVTNKCNFTCSFCPTGIGLQKEISKNSGLMSMDLFEKIVHDFEDLVRKTNQKIKKIGLFMMGEPLLNKKISKMIRLVKDAKIAESIVISTNGSLLSEKVCKEISASGIDYVSISMYGTSDSEYQELNKRFTFNDVLNNAKNLKRERGLSKQDFKIVLKFFENNNKITDIKDKLLESCDEIAFEEPFNWNQVYSDAASTIPISFGKTVKYCASPWFVMAIGHDGTVLTCSADWMWETKVGDLSQKSVEEVWNGDRLHNFKKGIVEGRQDENKACNGCTYYLVNNQKESNIDLLIDENPELALKRK
jgi:radical SAM protein with 4Fe4S-binding SPASM domain